MFHIETQKTNDILFIMNTLKMQRSMTLAIIATTFLSQSRIRSEYAIVSFKVDQRDKPIKRNRESPSASPPVEKVHGRRRSGKALPP